MGELHLDVIRSRIHKEHKVEAELGPLQVAYRETCTTTSSHRLEVDKTIGGKLLVWLFSIMFMKGQLLAQMTWLPCLSVPLNIGHWLVVGYLCKNLQNIFFFWHL